MKLKESNNHTCVCCLKVDTFEGAVPDDAKYLCKKCYKKVRKAYEKKHPGYSLRTKEDVEQ